MYNFQNIQSLALTVSPNVSLLEILLLIHQLKFVWFSLKFAPIVEILNEYEKWVYNHFYLYRAIAEFRCISRVGKPKIFSIFNVILFLIEIAYLTKACETFSF